MQQRIEFLETKTEQYKDLTYKTVEKLEEAFSRTKEQLEARADQIMQQNDKINSLENKVRELVRNSDENRQRLLDEMLMQTQRTNSVEYDLSTNKMLQEA